MDKNDLQRMSAALNQMLLSYSELDAIAKKMRTSIGANGSVASMTTSNKIEANKEQKLLICSVCGRRYNHTNALTGSVKYGRELRGYKNYADEGKGWVYRYCSLDCCSKLSNCYSALQSDIVEPYQKGIITH